MVNSSFKIFFFLIVIFAPIKSFGQSIPEKNSPFKVVLPSANAASLGSFGTYSVGYDGRPNISVSLVNIKTTHHAIDLALNYDAAGIKPGHEAAWTGLNWSLNAGGVISRTIRGVQDFDGNGYYNIIPFPPMDAANKPYYDDINAGRNDAEPDIFNYNINGMSGRFVLGRKNDAVKFYFDYQNSLKFECLNNGVSWRITDSKGYKYFFDTREGARDEYAYSGNVELPDNAPLAHYRYIIRPTPITSWYLNSIESPSGEKVDFIYDEVKIGHGLSPVYKSEKRATLIYRQGYCSAVDDRFVGKLSSFSSSRQMTQEQYLKKIVFANGEIEFGATDREDIEFLDNRKPQKLSEITVRNSSGRQIKKYLFRYDYYDGQGIAGRLRLTSVTEVDKNNNSLPPYEFHYNSNALPAKGTKSIDHWGFQNGAGNSALIPETLAPDYDLDGPFTPYFFEGGDRMGSADVNIVSKGVLTSITYPTGGKTEFQYELNDYDNLDESDRYVFRDTAIEVINSQLHVGEPLTKPFELLHAENLRFQWQYVRIDENAPGRDGVQFKIGSLEKSTPGSPETTVINFTNYNCPDPDRTCGTTSWITSEVVDAGNYNVRVEPLAGHIVSLKVLWKVRSPVISRHGGGLRIKKIISEASNGTELVKKYSYNINGRTTGKAISKPKYYFFYELFDQVNIGECPQMFARYFILISNSHTTPGLHSATTTVGYDLITETIGEDGNGGRTEYTYYNTPDDPRTFPYLPQYSSPYNGKLKDVAQFTANGALVKRTSFEYKLKQSLSLPGKKLFQDALNSWVDTYNVYNYDEYSHWLVPIRETETTRNDDKDIIMSKSFYYANSEHKEMTSQRVTTSDNKVNVIKYKYPSDYTEAPDGSFVKEMSKNNLTAAVIEQQTMQYTGTAHVLTGGAFTEFSPQGTQYLPSKTYTLDFAYGAADTLVSSLSSDGSLIKHNLYAPRLSYDQYDGYGNLIAGHKVDERSVAHLWGYKGQYLISSAENASVENIAFTSFEADSPGNWVFQQSGIQGGDENTPTGRNIFHLDNLHSLSKGSLPVGQDFLISYWSSAGPYSLAGGTGSVSHGPTQRGWTLYRHVFKTTQSEVQISGVGNIDELRLCPQKSMMTTYTHEPLVGVSSVADTNCNIQYYLYDSFSRLQYIKDQNMNVLKKYEYKYRVR